MAVRFDASGDYFRISSGVLDYNANYTILAWVLPTSNPIALQTFITVALDSSNYDKLRSLSSGDSYAVQANNGGTNSSGTGSAISYGAWQHIGLVRSGTSTLTGYLNGASNGVSSQSVTGRSAATSITLGASVSGSEALNARFAAIKIWTAALTADEIAAEMRSIRPVRLANLWGWYPTRPGSGERAKDYSGNGRNWTETGTLTDEDAPPIWWGARGGHRSKTGNTFALVTTIASLSSTSDSAAVAVARALTAAAASLSSTNSAALAIACALIASAASLSSTNDSTILGLTLPLTNAVASLSSTNDSAALLNLLALTTDIASLSSTNDSAAIAVERALANAVASLSSSNDAAVLAVARALSAAVASLSSTNDSTILGLTLPFSTTIASLSSTNDSAALVNLLGLATVIASLSSTNDAAAVAVARALVTAVASLSSTGDISFLPILIAWLRHAFTVASEELTSTAALASRFTVADEDRSSTAALANRFTVPADDHTSEA